MGDVFVFVAADAVLLHFALELFEEGFIAGHSAGLDERGLGLHVFIGQADAVFHRTHGVTHLESDVPQGVEQPSGPLGEGLQFRTLGAKPLGVQKHEVDVTEGIEFTASVTAKGHQRHLGSFSRESWEDALDGRPQFSDEHIHHRGSGAANVQSAGAASMQKVKSMALDLQKALVAREFVGRFAQGRQHEQLAGAFFDLRNEGIHRPPNREPIGWTGQGCRWSRGFPTSG